MKSHPDVFDAHRRRRARRALGRARRRRRPAARAGTAPDPRGAAGRTAAPTSPATRCRASCTSSTRSCARRAASPTTGGAPPSPTHHSRHMAEVPPTIPAALARAADRFGPDEALVTADVRLTFAELADRVARAAGFLGRRGIEPSDRVAIWAPNSPEWAIASLAIHSVGAVLVPLDTTVQRGRGPLRAADRRRASAPHRAGLPRHRLRRAARSRRGPRRRRPGGGGRRRRRPGHTGGGGRRRRPLRDHVHVGHHRRAQGRHAPPRHDDCGCSPRGPTSWACSTATGT